MTPTTKPPLGLISLKDHRTQRLQDIYSAMSRYSAAGLVIPQSWITEQLQLEEILKEDVLFPDKELDKVILFTTNDGVDIREGDEYYFVITGKYSLYSLGKDIARKHESIEENHKTFATRKSADNFILINKPLLSIEDIKSVMTDNAWYFSYNTEIEKFKKLAQQKLNADKI